MSTCVPASDLLFGRLSGSHLASSGKTRKKVEAFFGGPSSRAFNKKIAQFSKLFLARSLVFVFDGKSWDLNGSEIIKRRNFKASWKNRCLWFQNSQSKFLPQIRSKTARV
jgi:hypothetical protein